MKFRKRLWLVMAALPVMLLFAVPFLVPQSLILAQIQLLATEQLKQQVHVGRARFFLLPWPHVAVNDVTVGRKPFLEIDSISVTPKFSSLLSEDKVIDTITLVGVRARQSLVSKIEKWMRLQSNASPSPVRVERIELRRADVLLTSLKLSGLDADLELGAGNVLQSASIRIDSDRVVLFITPGGRHHAMKLSARNWTLPGALPLHISALDAEGKLTPNAMTLPAFSGTLYDGSIRGGAVLNWKRNWTLNGNAEIRQVEVRHIVAMFSQDIALSGRLDAALTFKMQAPMAVHLLDAPDVEVVGLITDSRAFAGP